MQDTRTIRTSVQDSERSSKREERALVQESGRSSRRTLVPEAGARPREGDARPEAAGARPRSRRSSMQKEDVRPGEVVRPRQRTLVQPGRSGRSSSQAEDARPVRSSRKEDARPD
ncbi:hypothetical protein LR48_Vigan07g254100 [Vigna angularis]|uniref:Uncharacterized protein n=1 Tax=Phaseolus angularis TaxID=3914 RepID=A0A0L9V1T7_PHAAN|nr:hypothetical protein LR48_Vigan07g254100 [Vigna angularis]